ncbi:MAG: hypothetical protein HC858_09555, partial [Brachymonas sp.]|nr:hypothetical protein [Brachymonas sp.]
MFDPEKPFDVPSLLRGQVPVETWESATVLRACIKANTALAALKEASALLPNADVMLSTLVLLESQASSEIENIVTTTDRLFQYAAKDANQMAQTEQPSPLSSNDQPDWLKPLGSETPASEQTSTDFDFLKPLTEEPQQSEIPFATTEVP